MGKSIGDKLQSLPKTKQGEKNAFNWPKDGRIRIRPEIHPETIKEKRGGEGLSGSMESVGGFK